MKRMFGIVKSKEEFEREERIRAEAKEVMGDDQLGALILFKLLLKEDKKR